VVLEKMGKEKQENKPKKKRLTLYVNEDKVELAKDRGYILSQIAEDALTAILDVENEDEIAILKKIQTIDKQIKKLSLQRNLLLQEMEERRFKKRIDEMELIRERAFEETIKEMRDTKDVSEETLERNAEIMDITRDELFERAKKQVKWPKKNHNDN
jgi:hypothetical protein